MFNLFSLRDMYDDQVSGYLIIISLCKWISILFIIAGLFLAIWFNDYWIAIIGGILIAIIGFFAAIISHYIRKKVGALAAKGGDIVSNMESSAKNKAKAHLSNIINKDDNAD